MSTFPSISLSNLPGNTNTQATGAAASNAFGFGAPATGTTNTAQPAGNIFGFGAPATGTLGTAQPTTNAFGFGAPATGTTNAAQPAGNLFGFGAPAVGTLGAAQPATSAFGFGAPAAGSLGTAQPTGSLFGVGAPAGQPGQPGQPGAAPKEQIGAEIVELSKGADDVGKAVLSFESRVNNLKEGEKRLTEGKQKMNELHQKVESAQREIDSKLSKLIVEFVKVQDTFAQNLGRVEADFGNKWYGFNETNPERMFGSAIRDLELKLNATDVSDGLISELEYAIDLIPQKKEMQLSEENIKDIQSFLDEEEEKLFKIEELVEKSLIISRELSTRQ